MNVPGGRRGSAARLPPGARGSSFEGDLVGGDVMGAVTGAVRRWLRAEGLAVLALSVVIYWLIHGSWLWFALLFLLPDLTFAAYLAGPRTGAVAYNLAHSFALPVALAAAALVLESAPPVHLALVWTAHIGLDRALGLGLKYPTAFRDSHLSRTGGT